MPDRLPTFLVIGAAKSGTTSLYHYLRSHPDVYMPPTKELNFFVEPDCLDRVDSYAREFADAGDTLAVGEASPRYTAHPVYKGVPERIAEVIPDVRMVYVVRHPVTRMQSHWHHDVLLGKRLPPIETALVECPVFFESSRYAFQIEQYLNHFAREQLLVVTAEALRDDRESTLSRVLRFIGVADAVLENTSHEFNRTAPIRLRRRLFRPIPRRAYRTVAEHLPTSFRRVVGPVVRKQTRAQDADISDELRRSLEERLAEDVRRLRTYIGSEDFDGWGIA